MLSRGASTLRAYVLLDTFNRATSGVTAYTRLANGVLRQLGVRSRSLARRPFESRRGFQERVARVVQTYRPEEVIVESPESGAASLLVPHAYHVHVRLHCAKAIGQRYEGSAIDGRYLDEEIEVIRHATTVSAPSRTVVRETRRFTALGPTHVYPNPIGFAGCASERRRDIDVLYLGRFQSLKGVGFLPELLTLLPEARHVVLAGPGARNFARAADLHRRVRTVEAPRGARKAALLHRSRVLVVPSLFESFSMVIGEALGHGVCSVAWSHAGAAEAVPAPLLRTAPPWDLAEFVTQTNAALCGPAPEALTFAACVQAINVRFRGGLLAIIGGLEASVPEAATSPDLPGFDDIPPVPATAYWGASAMNYNHHPATARWRRKLYKLRRDPVAFFSDARVVRAFVLPPGSPSSSTALAPVTQNHARPPSTPRGRNAGNTAVQVPAKPPATLAAFAIPDHGRIEIADLQPAEFRFSSVLLLRVGDALARSVHEHLHTQQDFVGFRERYLHVATYSDADTDPTLTSVDLLNRIDVANKQRLARFQNFIVFDPLPILIETLRAISPYSRVIVVISPNGCTQIGKLHPDEVDTVITPAGIAPTDRGPWRRILHYGGSVDIARALRTALHEAGSKYFNVLLPVWNGLDYEQDLLDLDTSRFDGLIKRKSGEPLPVNRRGTFRTYLQNLAASIQSLHLTEESFLRYRTLCDAVRRPSDLAPLLAFSLADGARYDVRT